MGDWIQFVDPNRTVEIGGIKLVGVNAENGVKLAVTVVLIAFVLLLGRVLRAPVRRIQVRDRKHRTAFWLGQAIRLLTTSVVILGLISIWFDDPARLATALGLFTAGLAFALQRVVTAVAGYFVILRGKTFHVADRIRMGGVRGDVISIDFIKTTIMEMGQPPPVQTDEPAMWVKSRQYTGRIVSVSNASIFDEPVYNYSHDFPFLWEEIHLPIPYEADRERAERLLLDVARRHTEPIAQMSRDVLDDMERRFYMKAGDVEPTVYWLLTDNWLELTLRFVTRDHEIRKLKDAMTRDILKGLDEAGIKIASTTVALAGLPPVRVTVDGRRSTP